MNASGKRVLITGASAGIGAALAREFARRGARLVLGARRLDRLGALAAELAAGGAQVAVAACDVADDDAVARLVALGVERFGGLDIAVANAGFGVTGRFDALALDDYRRQFETNVFGVLRTLRAALPEVARSRGGLAVIGSVSGHLPTPGTSAYCMSKFAVRAFAESIHDELAGDGVAVTLISPGFVDSEIRRVDNLGRLHEEEPDPVPAWLRMRGEDAARRIAGAILARRREAVITVHGKLLVWCYRHAPWLMRLLVARHGERKRGFPQPASPGRG